MALPGGTPLERQRFHESIAKDVGAAGGIGDLSEREGPAWLRVERRARSGEQIVTRSGGVLPVGQMRANANGPGHRHHRADNSHASSPHRERRQ
jgi:hypothetical protein